MSELASLIARRDEMAAKAQEAQRAWSAARQEIRLWGKRQVAQALLERGIKPGKSVVRMKVRVTRNGRTLMEETVCLFESVGRVDPPTMERGALGPGACSTEMWWCAHVNWRNIRKDGTPGAKRDYCLIQGDTAAEAAAKIEHVRDLP